MRRYTNAILLIVLAAIVAGCKSAPAGEPVDPAGPTTAAIAQNVDLGELSYIFEAPAEPVDVAVTLEPAGTVEALIPVEGGTISATGADGTVYTLEIPSDALLNETLIGLTPVTSVADLPFGGEQTYAVQLSPEGLFLFNYAILTITPAQEIPLGEQIFFGYLEDGKDLILAAPVVDSSKIQIRVLHFSGNGVTKGFLADVEQVRERLGGSAERRLDSAISAEMTRLRREGGGEVDIIAMYAAFEKAFNQYEEQVVKPRVDAAGDSCAAGKLAILTVAKLYLLRFEAGFMSSLANPYDKYPGLVDKFVRVCVQEEYELCVEQHIIHNMLPAWRQVNSLPPLLQVSLSDAVLQHARDLTIKCLTFKLKFESTYSFIAHGVEDVSRLAFIEGWETTVTSEITLRYRADIDIDKIFGQAPLVNTNFKVFSSCAVISEVTADDNTFYVNELRILPPKTDDLHGKVDFLLEWLTGPSDGVATVDCGPITGILTTSSGWSFQLLHLDEMDATGVFATTDWEFLGGELFAEKGWTRELTTDDTEMLETGLFQLYHTPGQ